MKRCGVSLCLALPVALVLGLATGCGGSGPQGGKDSGADLAGTSDSDAVETVVPDVTPEAEGYLTPEEQAREEAFGQLRAESAEPVRTLFRNGAPEVLLFDVPSQDVGDPVERGYRFVEDHLALFGLDDPRSQLLPVLASDDGEYQGVTFTLLVHERILYGSTLSVRFREDRARDVFAAYTRDPIPQLEPTVGLAQALAAVATALKGDLQVIGKPMLTYYQPQILTLPAVTPTLAWRIIARGANGEQERFLVDALNGKVLLRMTNAPSSICHKNFDIRTVHGGCSTFCWLGPDFEVDQWYTENGKAFVIEWVCEGLFCHVESYTAQPDADGENAFNYMKTVYNHFESKHQQCGWTLGGGEVLIPLPDVEINAKVHALFRDVMPPGEPDPCDANAQFIPGCGMAFSDGRPVLDIVAHEFTHGIVQTYWPVLAAQYVAQPGAINESLADTFAMFIDDDDEWIGEDVSSASCCESPGCGDQPPCQPGGGSHQAFRNLKEPNLCGDPDHIDSQLSSDGVGLCTGGDDIDNGWVHKNCTILSNAAYRLIHGMAHPQTGIPVAAVSVSIVEMIYWWRMVNRNDIPYSFQAFALAMVRATEELDDWSTNVSAYTVCSVRNAFAGAGLLESDTDCDGQLDPEGDDQDGDGRNNGADNCPTVANTDQADQDSDGDGRGAACDNCDEDENVDQVDTDADGKGDACDSDLDNDGVANVQDNCVDVQNPDQADCDEDNQGIACDPGDEPGPPQPPEPPSGPVFAGNASFQVKFGTMPLVIPLELCDTPVMCSFMAGLATGLEVQLGFEGPVRVLDFEGRILAQSPAQRMHDLVFAAPSELAMASLSPDGQQSVRTLQVEVMRPALMAEGDAYCKVYIVGPKLELANYPPAVEVGPDQYAPGGGGVTVPVLGSDPDSDPLLYSWSLVSGPAMSCQSVAGLGFTCDSPPAGGEAVVEVTATDPSGETDSDQVTIGTVPAGGLWCVARAAGLEPATSGLTVRCSTD